jgi:hypothetical protein
VDVGILLIFQNYQGRGSDADVMRDQMRLALLAEKLGYDKLWPPEHHFTDYSTCPDNIAFLAWLAGCTRRIALATGAVIVPWNELERAHPWRVGLRTRWTTHEFPGVIAASIPLRPTELGRTIRISRRVRARGAQSSCERPRAPCDGVWRADPPRPPCNCAAYRIGAFPSAAPGSRQRGRLERRSSGGGDTFSRESPTGSLPIAAWLFCLGCAEGHANDESDGVRTESGPIRGGARARFEAADGRDLSGVDPGNARCLLPDVPA